MMDRTEGITMSNLESAKLLHSLGWPAIPVQPNSKIAAVKWEKYQKELPTLKQLESWFKDPKLNIALLCGATSGVIVVDEDSYKEKYKGLELFSPLVVTTPHGGKHLYFKSAEGIKGSVNKEIAIDIRAEGNYVLVPDSTIDSVPYKWNVTPTPDLIASLPTLPVETINKLRPVRSLSGDRYSKLDIKQFVGVEQGARNDSMLRLADSLLNQFSQEDAWYVASAINRTFKQPLNPSEFNKVFGQAVDFVVPKLPDIHIPNATEFINQDFGKVGWVIENVLPIEGSLFIVARRGSYKTWLALHISKCITEGLPVFGKFKAEKNSVLYIANDDPVHNFKDRVLTFEFNDQFYIYHGHLPRFSIEGTSGGFEAVKKQISNQNIGVVVVDLLRHTHDRDSNTDKDTKFVFDKFKELREANPSLALIFLSHPTKEHDYERRFGGRKQEEAVGSYLWEGAVDTVISLTKKEDGFSDSVIVTFTKNKQSAKKIIPFVGIKREVDELPEYVYEEATVGLLKSDEAEKFILDSLAKGDIERQVIINGLKTGSICSERTASDILQKLVSEGKISHTISKPHIYRLAQSNDSANGNSLYMLQDAES